MEQLFHQLVEQLTRTNDLLEKQGQIIQIQQSILKTQKDALQVMCDRMAHVEQLQLQMGEILDRDLLSVLDQPLLDKPQVMLKLGIGDSTYRNYVDEGKLDPMRLGKIDYYFPRDLAKSLLATKGRRRKRTE